MCSLGTSGCPHVAFGNREERYSFEGLASFTCLNSQPTQFQVCGKMKSHFIWIMKRAFGVRISIVLWDSCAAFNHGGCLSYLCFLCKVKKIDSILSRCFKMWGLFFFWPFSQLFFFLFSKKWFLYYHYNKKKFKKERAFPFLIRFTLLQYSKLLPAALQGISF